MHLPIVQVDAFTDRPFAGNPAAVCLLPGPGNAGWMQRVAAEMNLSETAFVYRADRGFFLRWFTPKVEVALCGHATLATAHVIWQERMVADDETITFHTQSGDLSAARRDDRIQMDFPRERAEPCVPPTRLLEALGCSATFVGRSRFDFLVEVQSEDVVRGLSPDFARLAGIGMRGVMVTSASASPDFDFVSRYFAPGAGIDEDPVTGSAHCCLADHWCQRTTKRRFRAYQASARGGVVHVEAHGDRVLLEGQAVTVMRGELLVAEPDENRGA